MIVNGIDDGYWNILSIDINYYETTIDLFGYKYNDE